MVLLVSDIGSVGLRAGLKSAVADKKVNDIVVIDNASNDGSWEIANRFLRRYPDQITLCRSARKLTSPEIAAYAKHLMIEGGSLSAMGNRQKSKIITAVVRQPLISITIHNYNYGRYLRQCFESVVRQSYKNFEIIFSDNASSDESWNIALQFAAKYPDKITLIRNRINVGPHKNILNCYMAMRGRLRIELCSDDFLLPGCLEKCVRAFEKNPGIGFTMFHRAPVLETGRKAKEAPFYSDSVLIKGMEQAAVYMVAAINPSISQVCYDNTVAAGLHADTPMTRWWGARVQDFKICMKRPIAYIAEPLLGHRIGHVSDSSHTSKNLLEIIGPYFLNLYFLDIAQNHPKIAARYQDGVEKLATLSLRYASNALINGEQSVARRHYHLAQALSDQVSKLDQSRLLEKFFNGGLSLDDFKKHAGSIKGLLHRRVSYDPPKGSRPLKGFAAGDKT